MDWYIDNYWLLLLLLLLPLLGILLFRFVKWKNSRKNIFAEERFQESLFEKKYKFSKIFPILYLLASLFLIFAIIDLLNGKEEIKTTQRLNNVIFLLDVSNSMNAEDIQPNRLTEAKNIVLNTMGKLKNDRVGIVVFAGESSSIMPLTTDYTAADTYVSAIETGMVKIQGTDFLKAMQETVKKFKNVPKGSRKVVLISDGEDNEGNENEASQLAKKEGISVISVGIGTEEGAPVPEYIFGQLMGYKVDRMGQTVITKRQTQALEKISNSTGGSFIDGNNLEEATSKILDNLSNKGGTSSVFIQSHNAIHYYQYFLAVSLVLYLLIFLLNPQKDFNI